jgi:hypothetical protein
MADFHFFTEPNNLLAQTANSTNRAFGPIVTGDPLYAGGKDRFRITDLHAADSPHKAYAICNGVILPNFGMASRCLCTYELDYIESLRSKDIFLSCSLCNDHQYS